MKTLLMGVGLAVAFLLGHAMSAQGGGAAKTPEPQCQESLEWMRLYVTSVYDTLVAVQDNRIGKLDKFLSEATCAELAEEPSLYRALAFRLLGTQEIARIIDNKNKWRTADWDRIDAAFDKRGERWVERMTWCQTVGDDSAPAKPAKPAKKKAH
jgi:hypothetical protein